MENAKKSLTSKFFHATLKILVKKEKQMELLLGQFQNPWQNELVVVRRGLV